MVCVKLCRLCGLSLLVGPCANSLFISSGLLTCHDVCLLCRPSLQAQAKAEAAVKTAQEALAKATAEAKASAEAEAQVCDGAD